MVALSSEHPAYFDRVLIREKLETERGYTVLGASQVGVCHAESNRKENTAVTK